MAQKTAYTLEAARWEARKVIDLESSTPGHMAIGQGNGADADRDWDVADLNEFQARVAFTTIDNPGDQLSRWVGEQTLAAQQTVGAVAVVIGSTQGAGTTYVVTSITPVTLPAGTKVKATIQNKQNADAVQ